MFVTIQKDETSCSVAAINTRVRLPNVYRVMTVRGILYRKDTVKFDDYLQAIHICVVQHDITKCELPQRQDHVSLLERQSAKQYVHLFSRVRNRFPRRARRDEPGVGDAAPVAD